MPLTPAPVFTILQPSVVLADPHVLSDIRDRRSIIDAVYDALVRRDDNGHYVPWLAKSWTVDSGGQHWRFRLRDDVLFHDNTRLTARDAASSLLRAISPEMPGELGTQGVLRSYFEGAEISATGDTILNISTAHPAASLLDLLVDIPVVRADALPGELTGSGAYRPVSDEPGKVILQRFDRHWAGKPPVQQLVWQAIPDAHERLALLEQGKADLVVDPPYRVAAPPQGIRLISQKSYLCVIFLLNHFEGATCDIRVRKALNHAIDLAEIIRDPAITAGQADPLAGPLTGRHPGTPSDLPAYAYDPALARQLLAQAGYADGLTLELALPARFPDESIALANRIAEQLRDVGVTANLTVYEDRPAYAQRVRDKQFGDICCFDSSPASAWRVYAEKLDSRRKGPWWQGYHSDELNLLLDKIAETTGSAQREHLLEQAFTRVHDDAPWLFLYSPHSRWALGEKAAGWTPSFEGRVRIIQTGSEA
ncbi:ABC transporter substrate-binding protein [Rahnella sikkimica]|uniref:Solute-binding protein family 5 domain-containing protein n=1 Tax=Rahnella sikkimica TaxID=1805933 RepID=A0A2L1UN77_9GAMM|nr:ABC transporter substrate-binding protein [Rahnella sikkimica]AVF34390.1 hypothetical protein BV494_05365 [Rahnella sikkimica]